MALSPPVYHVTKPSGNRIKVPITTSFTLTGGLPGACGIETEGIFNLNGEVEAFGNGLIRGGSPPFKGEVDPRFWVPINMVLILPIKPFKSS